jgi:hypothetical protein
MLTLISSVVEYDKFNAELDNLIEQVKREGNMNLSQNKLKIELLCDEATLPGLIL